MEKGKPEQVIDKPPKPTLEVFPEWLKAKTGVEITSRDTIRYNNVVSQMHEQLENSAFWRDLRSNLNEFNDLYFEKYSEELLKNKDPNIVILKKDFE
jgi:hypothetical protein